MGNMVELTWPGKELERGRGFRYYYLVSVSPSMFEEE